MGDGGGRQKNLLQRRILEDVGYIVNVCKGNILGTRELLKTFLA